MKSLKSLAVAAALVFAVGVTDARANLIQVDNGFGASIDNVGVLEVGNLYLNGVNGMDYFVRFILLGGFSQYENTLQETVGNTSLIEGVDGLLDDIGYVASSTGAPSLLQFKFVTPYSTIVNGSNNSGISLPNPKFIVSWFSNDAVLIGLDDGERDWFGRDYNDWFGKIIITETGRSVPKDVPDGGSALALLGIALTGLGVVRRRLS